MGVILLLSTTILSAGFFRLIGMESVGYIPVMIALCIILYAVRLLYRNSPTWSSKYLPLLQKHALTQIFVITVARAIYHWIIPDRGYIRCGIVTVLGGLFVYSIQAEQEELYHTTNIAYGVSILIGIIIALAVDIIHIEMITITTVCHLLGGIGLITIRRHQKKADHYIDQLYGTVTYLGYLSLMLVLFTYVDFTLASIITTIILGGIVINVPRDTVDVTPDTASITAQDILEGRRVLDGAPIYQNQPTRQNRRGIQPHHGPLLIRSIIGILAAAILYQITARYSLQGYLSIREVAGFVSLTVISITTCTLYYLTHRSDGVMTLWKMATIIISNIAIGIAIVHLFYPHSQTIVIASILRNTGNNILLRGLYHSHYRDVLHAQEYNYRMIANTIITIINSILIITIFNLGGRQSTTIVLLGYRGIQAMLLCQIYHIQHSHKLTH